MIKNILDEQFKMAEQTVKNGDEIIHISKIEADKNSTIPISTGYKTLDDAMGGGFREGNLTIITGRSGEGKTTWAQNLCVNLSNNGEKCLFFSYEMTLPELKEKFEEIDKNLEALKLFTPKRMTSGNTAWIKTKIKEGRELGIRHFFIDHLDYLTPMNIQNSDQMRIKYKQITLELKNLANELGICIYLIAHVKKVDAKRELEMEDIAESSGIYQLANFVFGVKREIKIEYNERYQTNTRTDMGGKVTILKNRKTGNLTSFLKFKLINNRTVIITETGNEVYGQDVETI